MAPTATEEEDDDDDDDEDEEEDEDADEEDEDESETDAAAAAGALLDPPQALIVRLIRMLATDRAMAGRYARVMGVLYTGMRRKKHRLRPIAPGAISTLAKVLLHLINNISFRSKNDAARKNYNGGTSPLFAEGFFSF